MDGRRRRKASGRVQVAADATGEKSLRAKECNFVDVVRRFRYTKKFHGDCRPYLVLYCSSDAIVLRKLLLLVSEHHCLFDGFSGSSKCVWIQHHECEDVVHLVSDFFHFFDEMHESRVASE